MNKTVFILIFFSLISNVFAVEVGESFDFPFDVTKGIKLFIDDSKSLNANSTQLSENLVELGNKEIKVNYTKSHLWFELSLENTSRKDFKGILYFDSTLSGEINLYQKINNEFVRTQVSGSSIPYYKNAVPSTVSAFKVTLLKNQTTTFRMKRVSHHRFDSKVFLSSSESFKTYRDEKFFILYFYLGAILSLLIYNFFIFTFSKDTTYLYYCVFISSISLTVLNVQGFLDYVFSGNEQPPSHTLLVFSSFTLIFAMLFTRRFLNIRIHFPKGSKAFDALILLGILHIILFLSPLYSSLGSFLGITIDLTIGIACLLMLVSGVVIYRSGEAMGKFYLLSWFFLFSGIFTWFGMYAGIFPKNIYTSYGLLWGNIMEMLVVSLGLAYRISSLEDDRQNAELRAANTEQYKNLVRVLIHDIGTPLSIITTYSSLVERKPESFENNWRDIFIKMTKAAKNISAVIEKVRAQQLSKGSSLNIKLSPVSLIELLLESEFFLENTLKKKNINLKYKLHNPNDLVLAEKVTLVNNVFNNIISNACKFSQKNSEIWINSFRKKDSIYLEITDQGIGIPENLLNEFNRTGVIVSREGTMGEPGTGYGLLLIRNYMTAYGGEFHVTSNTKKKSSGTKITLIFKQAL